MIEKIITGIVLGKTEYEDEHIVKILSEEGNVLSLKAKGLHNNISKNRIALQPFNKVEVEYFQANIDPNRGRIKRATINSEYTNESELSFAAIQVMYSILYPIPIHNNIIYDAVKNILDSINNGTYNFQKMLGLFILVLRNEGYTPKVDACVKCGTNQKIKGFSLYEGGLICQNHEEGNKYSLDYSLLKKIIEINLQLNPINTKDLNLNPKETQILKSMYKMFFENQLGINLYLIKNI